MGTSPTRRDKCLRMLFYLNGGLLLFIVIIGTAVVSARYPSLPPW